MIRSDLKKKAQAHLHGHYGNWSVFVLIPCILLFIYFFFTFALFQSTGPLEDTDSYQSWQDGYTQNPKSNNDYRSGYDDGYLEGYDEGYEDGYYEEDSYNYKDHKKSNKKSLNALSVSQSASMGNRTQTVTYEQTTTIGTSIGGLFAFLLWVTLFVGIILYRGMIQWAAIDNVERRLFSFKSVFMDFIKRNGQRTIVANLLVSLYTFLWSLLFFVPGVVKQLSYGMTNYLLKKDPELSPKEAIALSQELMKGYKMEYLIFSYSFILWYFATIFSFGLTSLYVIPYYSVSEVLFFEQIISEKHHLFSQEKAAGFADF
ncbi:DUF975 family protein [Candidatus Enterococcus mansonii]|uniref:Integral membrane protein n=1 Tax=Candidatus Enterococcus mansonii TaxID=1834181 RepID=A0A242CI63_9ENTE|nr:DUF975 family protein [Enterococcus sp. 4G2_DIV0659]OTO09927.1 hypothetical protein A5880_000610 [Enterococcus sp. 4G2_DIV0659]